MKSLAREFVDTFEDIPTAVLDTLGSLVARPPLAVALSTPLAEVCRLLLQYRVPAVAVVENDH
ncbi:MAG TPA: CBS domain-containing protein, partial [Kofleriaceae bacterium]